MLLGWTYGPADLYYATDPWKPLASPLGVGPPRNPILSDLAFANLPWRAAVQEAVANGRVPLWNRFVLAGTPLLSAAQAGILHPATVLSLPLPLATSWTFSCTFTLFLALVCAFLFFRECALDVVPSLLGAVAWGFSTYLVFWVGWSVGPSTASFPLLLLGLRRLARDPGRGPVLLTAAALALSISAAIPRARFTARRRAPHFSCGSSSEPAGGGGGARLEERSRRRSWRCFWPAPSCFPCSRRSRIRPSTAHARRR